MLRVANLLEPVMEQLLLVGPPKRPLLTAHSRRAAFAVVRVSRARVAQRSALGAARTNGALGVPESLALVAQKRPEDRYHLLLALDLDRRQRLPDARAAANGLVCVLVDEYAFIGRLARRLHQSRRQVHSRARERVFAPLIGAGLPTEDATGRDANGHRDRWGVSIARPLTRGRVRLNLGEGADYVQRREDGAALVVLVGVAAARVEDPVGFRLGPRWVSQGVAEDRASPGQPEGDQKTRPLVIAD